MLREGVRRAALVRMSLPPDFPGGGAVAKIQERRAAEGRRRLLLCAGAVSLAAAVAWPVVIGTSTGVGRGGDGGSGETAPVIVGALLLAFGVLGLVQTGRLIRAEGGS